MSVIYKSEANLKKNIYSIYIIYMIYIMPGGWEVTQNRLKAYPASGGQALLLVPAARCYAAPPGGVIDACGGYSNTAI